MIISVGHKDSGRETGLDGFSSLDSVFRFEVEICRPVFKQYQHI